MSRLEEQLKQLGADFPPARLDAAASVAGVVKRGKLRALAVKAVAGVSTTAVIAGGAVVAPRLIDTTPSVPPILGDATPAPEHEEGALEDKVVDDEVVIVDEAPEKDAVVDEEPAKDDEPVAEPIADEEPAADTVAPDIAVTYPAEGQRFETKTITFEGETEPNAIVTAGPYEADVDAEGNWRITLILSAGKNTVTFKARDAAGNLGSDSVIVYYDAPAPAQPKEDKPPASSVGFTANQENSRTEWDPPYAYYNGTAQPGSKITILSDYGSATHQVGDSGEWRQKVWFEAAPVGTKTWVVTVKDSLGNKKSFEFTGVRPGGEAAVDFTAFQAWGAADGDPTQNVYEGTAQPGSKVKFLSDKIDGGWDYVYADEAGNFRKVVTFHHTPAGESTVNVTVKSMATGQQKNFSFTSYKAGAPAVAFTASQVYETCSEPVPYDVFHGTAQPGSKVKFFADHIDGGWTYVLADANGNWEKRVDFPSAPRGQTFQVRVHSVATGEDKYFNFTATNPS